ncbi:MAG: M48 family metalloprotease [Maricaulaceae bacterium]
MKNTLKTVVSALMGFILLTLLSACQQNAEASLTEDALYEMPKDESAEVKFSDILAEYQQLNTRLENIAARLQLANVELCPIKQRDPGYTVHTLDDYSENLQPVAGYLLGVDENLSLRTVRVGSPADAAGLKPGDKLIRVGTAGLPSGLTQKSFYDLAIEREFRRDEAQITVLRDDQNQTVSITPQTSCGYPIHVFFSQTVNGYTDGEAVWITSELMRQLDDDVSLALIVAHEMAHAIAGHMEQTPSKELELIADRMALIMLSRAGYDIHQAIAYWEDTSHPHQQYQNYSLTHPNIEERQANLNAVYAAIKKAVQDDRPLDFDMVDLKD